jgi:hypothetical protein
VQPHWLEVHQFHPSALFLHSLNLHARIADCDIRGHTVTYLYFLGPRHNREPPWGYFK